MPQYHDLIANVIRENKTVDSDVVWRELCRIYNYQTNFSSGLYPTGKDYLFLVEIFVRQQRVAALGQNFFLEILNPYFANRMLNPDSLFARLLEAYLAYYPELVPGLDHNVRCGLTLQVQTAEIQDRDIRVAIQGLYKNNTFSTAATFCLLIFGQLNDYDKILVATQVGANLANTDIAQIASDTLQQMCRQHANMDWKTLHAIVDERVQNADYMVRMDAILLLSEMISLPNSDLTLIQAKLKAMFSDEQSAVRLAVIKVLAKIIMQNYIVSSDKIEMAKMIFLALNDTCCVVKLEAYEIWLELAANWLAVNFLKRAISQSIAENPERACLGVMAIGWINQASMFNADVFLDFTNWDKPSPVALKMELPESNLQIRLYTELAELTTDNDCDYKKNLAVQQLIQIAADHERIAIDLILPALCRALHTASPGIVNDIALNIVESLSAPLQNYFLLGLLNPSVALIVYDENNSDDAPLSRLKLLLAKQILTNASLKRSTVASLFLPGNKPQISASLCAK
jgi:hypothetical protein